MFLDLKIYEKSNILIFVKTANFSSNACSAVIIPEACQPDASFDLNSKSGGGGGALGGAWNSALAKKKRRVTRF